MPWHCCYSFTNSGGICDHRLDLLWPVLVSSTTGSLFIYVDDHFHFCTVVGQVLEVDEGRDSSLDFQFQGVRLKAFAMRKKFVFQTTCMSPSSEGELFQLLGKLTYLKNLCFHGSDFLCHDTTHLFLGKEVAPTKVLMMALMRGKVKLVRLEDFERLYAENGTVGVKFFEDFVPRKGLMINDIFFKPLMVRNDLTLDHWTAIVSLQNYERQQWMYDILREGGATVLPYTLEKALSLLEDKKDPFGSKVSHIIVDPTDLMRPHIQEIVRVINRRRLTIDVLKYNFILDLLISEVTPEKDNYWVAFMALDDEFGIKLEFNDQCHEDFGIKMEPYVTSGCEEMEVDFRYLDHQETPSSCLVEEPSTTSPDPQIRTDHTDTSSSLVYNCPSDVPRSVEILGDSSIEVMSTLSKVEKVLKTAVEESRDQIIEHISGASDRNIGGISESLNRLSQEATKSRHAFYHEVKGIKKQLELFQKHLDDQHKSEQERVNANNEEFRAQTEALKNELRAARGVSVMTQTLEPEKEEWEDKSISQTPRPFHLSSDLGNLPDEREPLPRVLLFQGRLIYEEKRIEVIFNFARFLGYVPSSAFKKPISRLNDDLDDALGHARHHRMDDSRRSAPPSSSQRSYRHEELDHYYRKLQSVKDELRKEHLKSQALSSDLKKSRAENDQLRSEIRTLERWITSMGVRLPCVSATPVNPNL